MFSFLKKKTPKPPAASETLDAPNGAELSSPTAGLIGSVLVTPIAANSQAPAQGLQPGREPWLNKLKAGLRKTGSSISSVFTGTQIDEALYEDLETALLMADAGVAASNYLLGEVRRRMKFFWSSTATPAKMR